MTPAELLNHINAHRDVIGINARGEVHEGTDGPLIGFWNHPPDWHDHEERWHPQRAGDRVMLAKIMIARWEHYKAMAEAEL